MKTGTEPIRVFIAYSRQDKDLLDRLLKVLKTLIRKGIIEVWHDGRIPVGSEWDKEIKDQLNSTDIIVPLLSADSLASDYFHDDEMKPAFIRYYAGTCCIIPVVLNYCGWEDTRFESIQLLPLLPSNKKFLPLSDWDNYDKAFNEIRKEIRSKAKDMRAERKREYEEHLQAIEREKERKRQEQREREKRESEQRRLAEVKVKQTIFLQNLMSDMVLVKGGTFEMGATEEQANVWGDAEPVRQVTLDSYYISKYTAIFEQYDSFCKATGKGKSSDEGWGRDKHPVIFVSWYDAIEYCNWLSEQSGLTPCYRIDKSVKDVNNKSAYDNLKWVVQCDFSVDGFRLLTEAEWEYAARERGEKVRFGNGKNVADPKEINFDPTRKYSYSVVGEYRRCTVPVDNFAPNSLGVHNMSGNVWEWCWDWYREYSSEFVSNPKGANSGTCRVLRGGGWNGYAERLEVSYRSWGYPVNRYRSGGFRLARTFI